MNIDPIAGAGVASMGGIGNQAATLGSGATLQDVSNASQTQFAQAMETARANQAGGAAPAGVITPASASASSGLKVALSQLDYVNGEAGNLSAMANSATANGKDMSPGQMVQLTVRSQEFMFHCELTANIANRTSDGLQQLFKQQ